MQHRLTIITCLLLAPLVAHTGTDLKLPSETRTESNKVRLSQEPLPFASISAPSGFVGTRWRANIAGSIKGFDIDKHVRMLEERKVTSWWWIGEQPGKWLESAIWSSTVAKDAELSGKAHAVLERFEKAQSADGYLGISAPSVLTEVKPLRGMDPYEQYFTFHALLSAWEVYGDKAALNAACRLGDYYVNHIGEGKAEFWPSPVRPPENINTLITHQAAWVPENTRKSAIQTVHSEIAGHTAHYCWEGTLVVDPILRLYQATGEKRYLDWATWVVSRIDTWSGWRSFSRLDDVANGKIGVHQLQPYVHSHTFQMNFLGFLRLYQITGDKSLLRKVEGAWKDIVERQLYITGGVSVREHYESGYHRPLEGSVVETCANMSWMELNQYLLELSGDPKYAELIERLLFNHVFAAQTVDGESYRYHTAPNGMKPEHYFHGPDCCTASGHRLTSQLPGFFYAKTGDTAIVNQYVPSSSSFDLGAGRSVLLTQETKYPEEEAILIKVDPNAPFSFTLRLRIPAWCQSPRALVNNEPIKEVKPGSYLDINRKWKSGDRVALAFPMTARWVPHDHLPPEQARWALTRGPLVYAVDNLWWDLKEMPSPMRVGRCLAVDEKLAGRILLEATPAGLLGPALRPEITNAEGKEVAPMFVPFANVGVWYINPAAKPDPNSAAYSYAVWLFDKNAPDFMTAAKEERFAVEMRELLRDAIDYVRIGDKKSDQEHKFRATNAKTGVLRGQPCMAGDEFGWELKLSTEAPSELVVTYWGGEKDREFEILANGKVIGTQKLANEKPNSFFRVRYPIPFELIKGKTDGLGQKVDAVRIGFRSKTGPAGGVFGIHTELSKERP